VAAGAALLVGRAARGADDPVPFREIPCDGAYPLHLQGACAGGGGVYWCFTDQLVRTDHAGRVLAKVPVKSHHGDLCYHAGRLHVAVNFGQFNEPAGKADSWVYVYQADTLKEVARHPVPEVVHGAGGMDHHDGRFFVVGGLPVGVKENYVYEYDARYKFQKRHVLASGETVKGIQTACAAGGEWWFGCYGSPPVLLKATGAVKPAGRWDFNASVGLIALGGDRFLVARDTAVPKQGHTAKLLPAVADAGAGMKLVPPPKK
jgi:hypothetical protein